jgi:hypothetical protein
VWGLCPHSPKKGACPFLNPLIQVVKKRFFKFESFVKLHAFQSCRFEKDLPKLQLTL